jgi:hypothetical protein
MSIGPFFEKLHQKRGREAMHRLLLIISVLLPSSVEAATNTKLLLHGASEAPGWGTAGWLILPNLGQGSSPTVAVAGARYNASDWWVETMGGVLVEENNHRGLVDLRASYDNAAPVHLWSNVQLFPSDGQGYLYGDVNVDLTSFIRVGVESENSFFPGARDDWSIGPRFAIPFGDFAMIGAYQWHAKENVVWIRGVVDF